MKKHSKFLNSSPQLPHNVSQVYYIVKKKTSNDLQK